MLLSFFFFNDTATTEIYTLSLHDALPIYSSGPMEPRPPTPHFTCYCPKTLWLHRRWSLWFTPGTRSYLIRMATSRLEHSSGAMTKFPRVALSLTSFVSTRALENVLTSVWSFNARVPSTQL